MNGKIKGKKYHLSIQKQIINYLGSIAIFLLTWPISFLVSILIKLTDSGPIFFRQERIGLRGKVFVLNKFRTMKVGSENQQSKYFKLNEADGPVFKIHNDPRFTGIGKILSRTGMDELPQLINILNGDMTLVGPRPLPVNEARKLSKNQKIRDQVKPGIVSTWVTNGSHKLNFRQWMELDKEYVENGNLLTDLKVIKDSAVLIIKSMVNVLR